MGKMTFSSKGAPSIHEVVLAHGGLVGFWVDFDDLRQQVIEVVCLEWIPQLH